MNNSNEVAEEIGKWVSKNAFIFDKKISETCFMKYNNSIYPSKNPAAKITKDCQEHITKLFNRSEKLVLTEEPVETHFGTPNLAFDFFVPSERTAIELCCSVLENELEKDILKAILDGRVIRLIIIATNKIYRNTKYVSSKTWNQPGKRAMLQTLKGYKVESDLLTFTEKGVFWG